MSLNAAKRFRRLMQIAIASGAPPICGLTSAIIAGLVLPFLGGSYVTISGPAAGLAPALLAGLMLLGKGNLAVGYPLLLVAICLTEPCSWEQPPSACLSASRDTPAAHKANWKPRSCGKTA